MVVKGSRCVQTIADRFELPEWWVEAVLVEYYPCREFLEGEEVWLFNFDLVDDSISSLPSKKVVVGDHTLFHNIKAEDLKLRILMGLVGDPISPASTKKSTIIPEGPVNSYYIPMSFNAIDVLDPKLGFSDRAVVFDSGTFYQWTIAETYPIKGTHQVWWKSLLFDLNGLKAINDKIQKNRNTVVTEENKQTLKEELRKLYEELDGVREPIRQKIWEYHEAERKRQTSTPQLSDKYPPLLTPLDSVTLQEGKYRIRTYLDSLLYRAALRQLNLAKEAAKERTTEKVAHQKIIDEIEASVMCILCAHCCLEAYINSVIQDHCANYSNIVARMSVVQKWFMTPCLLGSNDCFVLERPPFSEFVKLNSWRNDITHFKHKWEKVARVDGITDKVGRAYAICNASNAQQTVDIVRVMIERLTSKINIPKPMWLEPDVKLA